MSDRLRRKIARSRLLVVGCGGLGSLFVIKAAYLGFRNFTLVDSDKLELSNLNRFIIAMPGDVGRRKPRVIQSYLAKRFPNVRCQAIFEQFPNQFTQNTLSETSLCVGCLDDVKARIELDLFARAAHISLLDLGCGFIIKDAHPGKKEIVNAGGQVIFSRPDGPCLNCLGFALDVTHNTYYVTGNRPDPSSLLLNSIIVSLGLECLLKELVNELGAVNRIDFNRRSMSLHMSARKSKSLCTICGVNSRMHIEKVAKAAWLYSKISKRAQCKIV